MKRYRGPWLFFWLVVTVGLAGAVVLHATQKREKQAPVQVAEAVGAGDATASPASAPSGSAWQQYVIGAQDVLAIDVWREPEISQVEPVRPDGKITLPLIGEIQAGGKTPTALGAEIAQQLSGYIQKPEVTVIVREANSRRFFILGDVLRPGSYPLGAPMTALDAIAVAGGFGEFAKVTQVYIVRRQPDGTSLRIRFDYKSAVRGDRRYLNLVLHPGDTIIVP